MQKTLWQLEVRKTLVHNQFTFSFLILGISDTHSLPLKLSYLAPLSELAC